MTNSLDEATPDTFILDTAPDSFDRLLVLMHGKGYAASWVYVQRSITEKKDKKTGEMVPLSKPITETHQELVIVREDGQLFTDAPLEGAKPLSDLGMTIHTEDIPANSRLWSGAGINRFMDNSPDPVIVFNDLCDVVNEYMDFHGSFGDQDAMCELMACYVMATYLTDAFPVTGYLWPNGEPGAGKSHLLMVISELAYLGQFITAGGSFASIRDMAGLGATLCFDDAEKIMSKNGDPDKQSLLLAGNRKGTTVTVKVIEKDKKWVTRHVNAYCPKCFSAIGLPNDTLSSRTLFIPLLASDDPKRGNSDPLDHDTWPTPRRALIDDLWGLSLLNIRKIPAYDKRAAIESGMSGRSYQPWRAIMGTALWMQEQGHPGLFSRIQELAASYGKEQHFSGSTHKVMVLRGLRKIINKNPGIPEVTFPTRTLSDHINRMAVDEDLMPEDKIGLEDYINTRSLGWRLNRMRLKRPEGRNPSAREWVVSAYELERMERAAGIPSKTSLTTQTPSTSQNGAKTDTDADVIDMNDISDVLPEGYARAVN